MHCFNCNSTVIGDGIQFNSVIDDRYKTNRISVSFILPLHRETASVYALLPSLLRKGTKSCPDFTEFSKKLAMLYDARVGYGVSAIGDCQVITVSIGVIDASYALEGENLLEEVSKILSEMVLEPAFQNGVFPETDIVLEKQSLIDLIESEINEKRHYALNRAMSILCAGEPAGVHKYGYIEDVKQITPQSAAEAYHNLLKTARIEIMSVGCRNPKSVLEIFGSAFADISREPKEFPAFILNKEVTLKEETDRMNLSQSKLVLGFRTKTAPDEAGLNAVRLMLALYGGTPSSKLFLNVREKLSLCYYCAARPNISKGIAFVDCGVEHENIQKAKEEILRQLALVQAGEFTDEELQHAKLSMINSFRSVGDSASAMENWYLSQLLYGTKNSPEMEAERISDISREAVIEAANKMELDTVYLLTREKEGGIIDGLSSRER